MLENGGTSMYKVVGVRFKKAGKVYYFDPVDIDLEIGCHVIVETARGIEYGEVVTGPKQVSEDEIVSSLKNVIREATSDDRARMDEKQARQEEAYNECLNKIEEHDLPMKLIDAEYTFDDGKLLFYFTSDGRVDFRELVKDLAAIFKTRIELRQIGVRDEAKMIGGLGPCGRGLCCASFLGEFEPVSIKMAKTQNLSLNPAKISGLCGRLMCCLRYEYTEYKDAEEEFPCVGKTVMTPEGKGEVSEINVLKKSVLIKLSNGTKEFALDEVKSIDGQGCSNDSICMCNSNRKS